MSVQTDEEVVKPCIQDRLWALIGCAGVSVFKCLVIIFSVVSFLYTSGRFIIEMNLVSDFKINLITELIGIGITFLLIERWIEMREKTRRTPYEKSLLLQICWSYYSIGHSLRNLIGPLVYACVDNDINWIIGRLGSIDIRINELNRLDNLSQDLLSFEVRNELLQMNSVMEMELTNLRRYEDSPLTEEFAIMEIVELTLLITRIVVFLDSYTELAGYDLDDIRVPIFGMTEARDYYNTTRDDAISSRAFWAQKRQEDSDP